MKNRKRWSRKKPVRKILWLLTAVVLTLIFSQHAFASTAANTTITNSVTVTFDNAAGVAQTAVNATATVIVNLVAAVPTLSSPASIDPATESTLNVLTYTITGNANGADAYTLSTTNTNDANLSAASLVVNGGAADSGNPVVKTAINPTTMAAIAKRAALIAAGAI